MCIGVALRGIAFEKPLPIQLWDASLSFFAYLASVRPELVIEQRVAVVATVTKLLKLKRPYSNTPALAESGLRLLVRLSEYASAGFSDALEAFSPMLVNFYQQLDEAVDLHDIALVAVSDMALGLLLSIADPTAPVTAGATTLMKLLLKETKSDSVRMATTALNLLSTVVAKARQRALSNGFGEQLIDVAIQFLRGGAKCLVRSAATGDDSDDEEEAEGKKKKGA